MDRWGHHLDGRRDREHERGREGGGEEEHDDRCLPILMTVDEGRNYGRNRRDDETTRGLDSTCTIWILHRTSTLTTAPSTHQPRPQIRQPLQCGMRIALVPMTALSPVPVYPC